MNNRQNGNFSNNKQSSSCDGFDKFYPISKEMQGALKSNRCNFSLYFPRMVKWEINNDKAEPSKDNMETLLQQGNNVFKCLTAELSKKHRLQDDYLKAMESAGAKVFRYQVMTVAPFITGLGAGHPTETGITLDRNLGVPYIPASSVKGVLRMACAIEIARESGKSTVDDDASQLEQYFGSYSTKKDQYRGQLIFLDAYPINNVQLKLDIMNPHFTEYYNKKNSMPVEKESPVPIKFLTVAKGTKFNFCCVYIPLQDDHCDEQFIDKIFDTAFKTVGFGSKTAIGYGRFRRVTDEEKNGNTSNNSSNNSNSNSNSNSNVSVGIAGEKIPVAVGDIKLKNANFVEAQYKGNRITIQAGEKLKKKLFAKKPDEKVTIEVTKSFDNNKFEGRILDRL